MRSVVPTSRHINSCNSHCGPPCLHPIRCFSYCILHDRLQQAFKFNVHPEPLSLQTVSSNDFFPHPSPQPQTPLVSLWTLLRLWFLYWRELIFIRDNKCSLVRYQHTLLFPFTTSDVGKIRFCCQIVDLMISFLFLIQISANAVSFPVLKRRLNSVTARRTPQTVTFAKYERNAAACNVYIWIRRISFKWENLQCNIIKELIVWGQSYSVWKMSLLVLL